MTSAFVIGQEVIATCDYMHQITEGKRYVVTGITPRLVTPTFTFPEYVEVVGDFGTPVSGHTHRFKAVP